VPVILLTNDDGIEAAGLRALEETLQGLGTIVVLAPHRERSAVSHGLTIREPLELTQLDEDRYSLTGTPADCVLYALKHLGSPAPDLVVSGINHGANLGDDIMYSGTVAAAREAARNGIPAIACSQAYDELPIDFERGKPFIRSLVEATLSAERQSPVCLNVNIPSGKLRGAKVTRQGTAAHFPHFNRQFGEDSPDSGAESALAAARDSLPQDYRAVTERYVSIMPLQRDQTDYQAAEWLKEEVSRSFPTRSAVRIWVDRIKELG
jgi:5'/3'-nucleotidase